MQNRVENLLQDVPQSIPPGDRDIVEYITHLNDENKADEMPESVMREECKSDCEPM